MDQQRSWDALAALDPPPVDEEHGPGPTSSRRRAAVVAAALVVPLLGGYAVADAYGYVPGILTVDAPHPRPEPFPSPVAQAEPPPGARGLDAGAPVPSAMQPIVDALATDPRVVAAVPGLPAGEPAPPDAPEGGEESGLLAQSSVPPGTPASVLVLDADTGQLLGEHHSSTPRVPASTLKILTGAAVLATLDPAATIPTTVTLDEGATVTLVGGGDVLLSGEHGSATAVTGRAGLADLADQCAQALREAGRTSVQLRLDDTAFPPEGLAAGLNPQDERWVMPPAALAIDQGMRDGGRARDPGIEATQRFAHLLRERGIAVAEDIQRHASPAAAQELARVESAPLSELVRLALKESDNTVTEALARQVAFARGKPTDRISVSQEITEVLTALEVDTTGLQMADASGLSPHNRVTTTTLAQTLELGVQGITQEATQSSGMRRHMPALINDLPVAGLDGTLDDRLAGRAAGVTRGKTGTLGAVASLGGTVLDADGRLLVYVVLADGLPQGGQPAARDAIDEFISAVSQCGC